MMIISICAPARTSLLFGDELPKQVKDLTEVNQVGKKVTHSRSSKANDFGYKSRASFGYGRNVSAMTLF